MAANSGLSASRTICGPRLKRQDPHARSITGRELPAVSGQPPTCRAAVCPVLTSAWAACCACGRSGAKEGAAATAALTRSRRVLAANFRRSLQLLDWCTQTGTRFIYASSAATYGDGAAGFSDDWSLDALRRLKPMNLYGWSKHLFDLALVDRFAKRETLPPQWAGLKFFNVFGPNEYHKGAMASVLARVFDGAKRGEPVRLFKSHRPEVADGEQKR